MATNLSPQGVAWADSVYSASYPTSYVNDSNDTTAWFSVNIAPPHFCYVEWSDESPVNVCLSGAASSIYGTHPEYANDGNYTTSWLVENTISAWWQCNFDDSYEIDRIRILAGSNCLNKFTIEYYDGSWHNVTIIANEMYTNPYDGTGRNNACFFIEPVTASKVKITLSNTTTFKSLYEFEVFAKNTTLIKNRLSQFRFNTVDVRTIANFRVDYWDDTSDEWALVSPTGGWSNPYIGNASDDLTLSFDPVNTSRLRLYGTSVENNGMLVYEWEARGDPLVDSSTALYSQFNVTITKEEGLNSEFLINFSTSIVLKNQFLLNFFSSADLKSQFDTLIVTATSLLSQFDIYFVGEENLLSQVNVNLLGQTSLNSQFDILGINCEVSVFSQLDLNEIQSSGSLLSQFVIALPTEEFLCSQYDVLIGGTTDIALNSQFNVSEIDTHETLFSQFAISEILIENILNSQFTIEVPTAINLYSQFNVGLGTSGVLFSEFDIADIETYSPLLSQFLTKINEEEVLLSQYNVEFENLQNLNSQFNVVITTPTSVTLESQLTVLILATTSIELNSQFQVDEILTEIPLNSQFYVTSILSETILNSQFSIQAETSIDLYSQFDINILTEKVLLSQFTMNMFELGKWATMYIKLTAPNGKNQKAGEIKIEYDT